MKILRHRFKVLCIAHTKSKTSEASGWILKKKWFIENWTSDIIKHFRKLNVDFYSFSNEENRVFIIMRDALFSRKRLFFVLVKQNLRSSVLSWALTSQGRLDRCTIPCSDYCVFLTHLIFFYRLCAENVEKNGN